jgi:hypothetical protein
MDATSVASPASDASGRQIMVTQRNRSKGAAAAQALLPSNSHVGAYVFGRGHARMTTGAAIATGVFAVAFIVGLMLGVVFFPGALLVWFVINEVRPPRGLAVTDDGVVLMARTFWRGLPSRVMATVPAPRVEGTPGGRTTLDVGPERVTLSGSEFERLAGTGRVTGLGPAGGPRS